MEGELKGMIITKLSQETRVTEAFILEFRILFTCIFIFF